MTKTLVYENPLLGSTPGSLTGLQPSHLRVSVPSTSKTSVTNDGRIRLSITSTAPVSLFVTLTTQAHGRFSNNAFLMEGYQNDSIFFLPYYDMYDGVDDVTRDLQNSLRIEDLSLYIL